MTIHPIFSYLFIYFSSFQSNFLNSDLFFYQYSPNLSHYFIYEANRPNCTALYISSSKFILYYLGYTGAFALSWLAGYCQYEILEKQPPCTSSLVSLWDKYFLFYLSQSFTIHGLWPDNISSTNFGGFNTSVLAKSAKLLDDMHNYWPPQSKSTTSSLFLWDHEWTTHGKDYANIIYKLRPADFPGTVEQRNF